MQKFSPQLCWVDLQMSGLDPLKNRILEFACILTDNSLNHEEQGPHIIIHCDKQHLDQMDQWNTTHHKASGLYESCLKSTTTIEEAEKIILEFFVKKGIVYRQLIIAGNSIHMDKLFLFHHMPKLNQFLHYRILDVSSVKIVVNAKLPHIFYKKKGNHRAIDDIRESIGELKHYYKFAFK